MKSILHKAAAFLGTLLVLVLSWTPVFSQTIQGDWNTQANNYRGRNGEQFTYYFPPGGTISGRVWGTNLYTDDCSIASAAVHAGLITASDGGTVTIEIKPGSSSYVGTTRNGVTSKDYGPYSGSFIFVSGRVNTPGHNAIIGDWNTRADQYRGRNGERFTFQFPAGGTISSRVWGTGLYTDDCSIASAAVHAGLISTSRGGTVTIEIKPGASSYRGTTQNGVSSKDYGAFQGSFIFVKSHQSNPVNSDPPSNIILATWSTQADAYRGKNYQRFSFKFPPGGTISGRLWGTDLYTDDGSIASAAVHAGLITVEHGGVVTIEIRPGANSYSGSTRNGVTSNNWGAFQGSFVFVR